MAETLHRATEKPFHSDNHTGQDQSTAMARMHPQISPTLPCTLTHPPRSQPAGHSSIPNSEAFGSPARRWRPAHTEGASQTLLPNLLRRQETAGSRGDYVSCLHSRRNSFWTKEGLVAVLPCWHHGLSTSAAAQVMPPGSEKTK
ncbi:uncharacterized protein LOC129737168 isoform X2 [Falco cherrug]|uniref:uncharacterized protein LOC129737168 isoform X2 n=1 Tax=Falco cherrug TaxID=345164 RepID=UPI0024787667|nr:uncharacterized protein LOC129737168 isoform X2 [Falco cherrug]